MKPFFVLAIFVIFGGSSFGQLQTHKTWEGFVTDTHCGTHCQRTTTMTPDISCIRRCVKRGSKYGLWSGNHVYVLEPQQKASRFAAENVRVTGDMVNETIQIQSIMRLHQQGSSKE